MFEYSTKTRYTQKSDPYLFLGGLGASQSGNKASYSKLLDADLGDLHAESLDSSAHQISTEREAFLLYVVKPRVSEKRARATSYNHC